VDLAGFADGLREKQPVKSLSLEVARNFSERRATLVEQSRQPDAVYTQKLISSLSFTLTTPPPMTVVRSAV
jgi:hypothetical protein